MHHPKEAVIDGVKFVLIPEGTLEHMKLLLSDLIEGAGFSVLTVEELYKKLGEL